MPETEFTIEEVRDVEAAWSDLRPLLQGIVEYHRPFDNRALREDWEQRWRDHLASLPDGLTLLARTPAGRPIGFLTGIVRRDYGIFEGVPAFINNAFVEESERRRGVGSGLLERFEEWCEQEGTTEIGLSVRAANELGLRFWTNAGFQITDHTMAKPLGVR